MSAVRFIAVVMIFGAVTVAWWVLGGVTCLRTERQDSTLSREMASLWGPEVVGQASPYWATAQDSSRTGAKSIAPAASEITADIVHENRYKGLLNYSTFKVAFSGRYTITPADDGAEAGGFFIFPLPPGVNHYYALDLVVDGDPRRIAAADIAAGNVVAKVDRDAEHTITVTYEAGGQEVWLYAPAEIPDATERDGEKVFGNAGLPVEINNFSLTIGTDFANIDYPRGTRSPNKPASDSNGGRRCRWEYTKARTNNAMGIVVPKRQDAGPMISRMSFFAPVSLFFFLTVLFTVVVIKKLSLHPMHYLFIAAGFFAFHILLAYLGDVIQHIHWAFWICAAVSVFLVVSYMRLVAGVRFALTYVAAAQLVYLVGFSYAFFWKGYTGLTVVIGAIVTLFVLMQATGRAKWQEFFGRRAAPPAPAPAAQAPPEPPPPPGGEDWT